MNVELRILLSIYRELKSFHWISLERNIDFTVYKTISNFFFTTRSFLFLWIYIIKIVMAFNKMNIWESTLLLLILDNFVINSLMPESFSLVPNVKIQKFKVGKNNAKVYYYPHINIEIYLNFWSIITKLFIDLNTNLFWVLLLFKKNL